MANQKKRAASANRDETKSAKGLMTTQEDTYNNSFSGTTMRQLQS